MRLMESMADMTIDSVHVFLHCLCISSWHVQEITILQFLLAFASIDDVNKKLKHVNYEMGFQTTTLVLITRVSVHPVKKIMFK